MSDIEELIIGLKSELANYRTEDVLGYISNKVLPMGPDGGDISSSANIFKKTKLRSPLKQYLYLAGLLISTEYNEASKARLSDCLFEDLENRIQRITDQYLTSFGKFLIGKIGARQEEKDLLFGAVEAFDSYFNATPLNYSEQIESRIKLLFYPFDSEIQTAFGITAKDMLSFYNFVFDGTQESLERMSSAIQSFSSFCNGKKISGEDALIKFNDSVEAKEVVEAISGLFTIRKDYVIERFGLAKAERLMSLFVSSRRPRDFKYYAFDDNPFVKQPLVWVDEKRFFVTFPYFLLSEMYYLLNDRLFASPKFVKYKGGAIEDLTYSVFKQLFRDKAKLFRKVCEQPGTDEHDLLLLFDKYILVIEVKGSKVKTPRRDLEKSAAYLKEHFFGKTGIGYAYGQAIKLMESLGRGKTVKLYEEMNKPISIDTSGKRVIPVVITLEQFGQIGINTSFLIKPENNQPYPWVCCIDDLENILVVNDYLKITPEKFVDYIRFRLKWHSNIMASDELELLERYYAGKLKGLRKDTNLILWPSGTSLIDKIYFENHGAKYIYDYKQSK